MAEYPGNMDESIVTFDAGSFLGSSVLIPMGIKINKPNTMARLNEVMDEFNETYLETMDFLTQILPLAREMFGRSDNLLLPKTPSKKRHRKVVQDLSDQENCNPNIPPQEPPPVKRAMRSSKRNNPAQIPDEPIKTRSTRGQPKKSEQSKVTFVNGSKTQIVPKYVKPSPKKSSKKSPATTRTLKRTSSTSPTSIKPVKKKSKSSDELSVDEDNLPKEHTSTPVSTEPPQMFSLSLTAIEAETKSNINELVDVVEKDKTKLLISEKLKVVEMDIDINEKNEPQTSILVEISNDNNAVEQHDVVLVLDSPPSDALPLVKVEPETAVLVNINETPPANINETVDKITNEALAESPVINKILGKTVNETVIKETPDKITNKVVVNEADNELVKDEQLSMNTESVVRPTETKTSNKCIEKDGQASPIQPLRCSKRLSKQNANELVAEPLPKQKKQVDVPASIEEPTCDCQDESSAQSVVSETPESKPVRRSNRLSRRISKVSTGYKRRSSRRSSRPSSYFRKPLTLKQVEVHLSDVGINEVVKPESSAKVELHKAVLSSSEHSSTESEDDAPKMSSSIFRSNTPRQSSKTDSSSDETAEPAEGTVAGMIQKINRKTFQNEQTSLFKTPNGIRKIKRIGSAAQGSSQKPPNLVGGNIKSFIKRQSVKKFDANEVVRQKKLELQRKEEKERERKDQAELRRKNWAEEQKRKREEKQKRVAEAKAAREREEQDKKQRQLEDKRQMLHASEQARKKREHEEETKKRLREQRTKEAEGRRFRENEDRLKRLQEKEEEDKMYRELLKRKQEQEEHDRKQKIQEEKRLHEQKQRERAREKEEERERRLREMKERQAKRLEKEEAEKREREDKERKQREQEERQNKRIAQLIKDKMEQEKKLHEEKLQKEEKERKEREEERKREERSAMLQAARTDSYLMTPPPAQTRKPATSENYDISDICSDESTDDEDAPRKKVPHWAQGAALKGALLQQVGPRRTFEELASGFVPHAPDLEKIFTKKRKRFYQRTSSAHWNSPPLKV